MSKIYEGRKVDEFIIYYVDGNGEPEGYEVYGVKQLKSALKWLHSDEVNAISIDVYKRGKNFDNDNDDVIEYYSWKESKKSARKSIKESSRFPKLDEFKKFYATDDRIAHCEWEDVGRYTIFCEDDVDIEKLAKEMLKEFNGSHYNLYNKSSMPHLDRKYPNHFEFYLKWYESKKSARKSIKESRQSILDKRFYELVDEGYIYDEDENGMNMSYGEYFAVSDDLWETLENELEHYRDFPSAYDAYNEIMNNTGDDAKMFMGVSDDDYFYFEINEDENTYSFSGEVPTVLEKLFKKFLKETDFERV